MIGIDKLKIYKKYNGDIDLWAMQTSKQNKMSDSDWSLIDSFLQDLVIIKNGQASGDFAAEFHERLKENFDGQHAIDFLMSLQSSTSKSGFKFFSGFIQSVKSKFHR